MPISFRVLLVAGGVLCVLLSAALAVLTSPTLAREPRLAVEVRPADVMADVEGLVAAGPARCFAHPAGLDAAAAFIRRRFEAAGYPVAEQEYQVAGKTFRNLMVDYGPGDLPRLVVGAHYDVRGEQPGADDNASGVAALLELARLLQRRRPDVQNEIQLVAYTLEEPPCFRSPHQGSAVHAAALAESGVRVRGAVVIDCVGYFSDAPGSQECPAPALRRLFPDRGDFIAVVGRVADWRLTRAVKARMAGAAALPVRSMNAPTPVAGVDDSDHRSYWPYGWSAVMVTDTAFFRNPNYHQPSDTPDTLDPARLAEVVEGIYAAVAGLD
jgi:hypothetical protein